MGERALCTVQQTNDLTQTHTMGPTIYNEPTQSELLIKPMVLAGKELIEAKKSQPARNGVSLVGLCWPARSYIFNGVARALKKLRTLDKQ